MPDGHVRFSEYARQLIQEGGKRAGRGAMSIVLTASMTGAMVPAVAIAQESTPAEVATSKTTSSTVPSTTSSVSTKKSAAATSDTAPAFNIAKQSVGVVVYAAGEWDPAYEGTVQIPSGMVQSVSKPYQKDGRWFVDVELKQGTPKDYGVGDKTSDGVYLFDDANSVTTFSFATDSFDGTTWTAMSTEDGGPKVVFYQVAAPDADAIVNAKVTVRTTDLTKEGSYYLGAGTYEVGPVIMGYAGPVCVVTLKSDQQQSYVDEFNVKQANGDTYELSVAKPSDLQFYFSYDPETQEWTSTTSDQYIYVKKAPEKAPTFDAAAVVENDTAVAAQIKLAVGTTVDAGAASIKDVAASYQASDRMQDKDGNWTATITIFPKAFADYPGLAALVKDNAAKGSTFELDSESSNLTLTYRYSKDSGTWVADGQATVVFQEKVVTPAEPQNPQDRAKPTTPAAPTTDPSTNNSNTKTTNAASTSNNTTAKKNVPAQTSTAKKATANSSSLPKTGDTSNAAGAATAGIIGIASVALSAVSSLLQKRRNQE